MKNILLIDPSGVVSGFNTGIGYIASILLKEGYNVDVVDLNNYKRNISSLLPKLIERNYSIIGLSLKTHTLKNGKIIGQAMKNEKNILIAGGPQITIEKEFFLKENNSFDYGFAGEVEDEIINFIKYLEDDFKIEDIKGVIYRKDGEVISNPHKLIQNLDTLPYPDYSHFDSVNLIKDKYPLVTSRGCPQRCIYCSVGKISGYKFRGREADNVIDELIEAIGKYKITKFEINDDNFTFDLNRAKEICRLIIKKNLKLLWKCNNGIKADKIDEELVKLMKKAGCYEVWIGIETLSEDVFKNIKKGEKIEDIKKGISMIKKAGMEVAGFFIIGLPYSNYKKDLFTLKEAKKLKLDKALFSYATPIPHTELWEYVNKNAKIIKDYREMSFFKDNEPTYETVDYKAYERKKIFYKANLSFSYYASFFTDKIGITDILKFISLMLIYSPQSIFDLCKILFSILTGKKKEYVKYLINGIKNRYFSKQ